MEHTDEEILELIKSSENAKKNPKQLSQLIRIIFSSPQNLNTKFHYPRKVEPRARHHSLDIQQIQKLYSSIKLYNKSGDIAQCLQKSFSRFQKQGQLKSFLKNYEQMRYFFILVLWDQIYTNPTYKLLLIQLLNLIAHSGTFKQVLTEWLDDIKSETFSMIVINIQRVLQLEAEKLHSVDPAQYKFVQMNIRNYCLFLSQLYKSNKSKRRLPDQAFVSEKISQMFQPIGQFKLFLKNIQALNFLKFAFLLPLDYKLKLLTIQSIYEQKVNMQKNVQQGFSNALSMMLQMNGNFSLEGLVYLHFQINRHNILDDSMEKLCKAKHNLKSPMRISFIGQEGSDEGGVKNQYFQLVIKGIFNPYLDMFIPKNNNRIYWFNGFSFEPPIRFQFVGMLLGLAIYNSVLLDIHLPKTLYRKLLSNSSSEDMYDEHALEDLQEIDPGVAEGLKKILETQQDLDCLQLYFNIQFENFGEKIIKQLVDDGNNIKVNQQNKHQYCSLYADYYINKHTAKFFNSFKKGFLKVVSGGMIHLLEPEQLQRIICGSPTIDFKQMEQSANYEGGYNSSTPVIKNLWEVLHSLSLQQKKAFLIFLTGTDRVPLEGLKGLHVVIQKHSANTEHLPSAHTCFNVLLLPEYQTKQKLESKIRLILNHNQGFGLI